MSTGIGFNYIPGSGLTAPIFSFEVNSGGQFQDVNCFIIVGHKLSAGTLAVNTPTPVASQNDADVLTGAGSMLREQYRIASQNSPAVPIWLVATAETGVAGVWTITINSVPGVGSGWLDIGGERLQFAFSASDTPTTIATAIAAAINAYWDPLTGTMLQVTATSSAGVVTVTSRHAGALFDDLVIVAPVFSANLLAGSGVVTIAHGTAGTGTPAGLAATLAALGDYPADIVVSPWSDSTSTAVYTAATNDVSGRWAWSRQSYGHVWTVTTGTFSAATTLGLTLNDRHLTVARRWTGTPTPAYTWITGVAARVAQWLFDCVTGNVSRNQTGLAVQGLKPPVDGSVIDNYSGRNTLNNSGISTLTVDPYGNILIDKLITTYRTGASGQPDTVFRDVQSVYQVAGGLKYFRAQLAQAHGQKSIADANPGNLAAISTPSDIKATFIHAYTDLESRGVFENSDEFSRLLVVKRNVANPARVDVYAPLDRVNPLDILAANATIYAQYPAAV
jgi:phage tail sheath gpL-like